MPTSKSHHGFYININIRSTEEMKKLYISLDSYILEHFVIIVMQLKTPSFRTLIERRVYKTSMFGPFLIVLVVEIHKSLLSRSLVVNSS